MSLGGENSPGAGSPLSPGVGVSILELKVPLTSLQAIAPSAESFAQRTKDYVSRPVTAAFMAGGVAGAVSRTVVSPLERLKILYQIQTVGRNEYEMSIWKALKKMWTEEGWRGFMRGNGTNCVRIVPYSAVQFGSYSVYKKVGIIILQEDFV